MPEAAAAKAVAQAQARSLLNVQHPSPTHVLQAQAQVQAAVAAAQARAGSVAAAATQQHVLPHQRPRTSQDEKTRKFFEQALAASDIAASGAPVTSPAPTSLHPGLQLEAMTRSAKSTNPASHRGPEGWRSVRRNTSSSKLFSLPGAGDSASVNESPNTDPTDPGGSFITERSGGSASRPFGSDIALARQGPASNASPGKPRPSSNIQQR